MRSRGGWLAWGCARGAVPALGRWTPPDWATRARLEAAVGDQLARSGGSARRAGELVLWRPDTGAVVVALAGGALAVVALAGEARGRSRRTEARPPRTRVIAGWEAWPRARPPGTGPDASGLVRGGRAR